MFIGWLFPFLAAALAGFSSLKIFSSGKNIFHSSWKVALPA
jgi:hypothetical protein